MSENKTNSTKKSLLAKLALLIVAILWGSSLTVVKQASDVFNPNFILAIRFTVACAILSIVFWKKIKNATRGDFINGMKIGCFLFIAYSSQTLGVTYTDPGRSAFLSASYCVIVPFLAWLFMKKRPDKFNVMAAIFCVTGIYFVSMAGGAEGSVFAKGMDAIIGDGLALLSGVLFAAHIVAVQKFSEGRDPILMTIVQFAVSAVLSWIVTLLFEDNSAMAVTSSSVFEILYLAVMCTAVALLLQNIGQKYTDESSAAIILGLESVFGILIPVMLGIEILTKNTIIGFVLIFIAIIISETKLSFIFPKNKSIPNN
ncbi:DMT family transporter [Ignavigranum ruoffiae]|uniref:DMT family transporter n=1 Tax=Ignavigranum ruoffiae TaxID=89093 RepID=UPI0024ACE05D|nr:DMT family transporter [Ignavigranum ruoffiae]